MRFFKAELLAHIRDANGTLSVERAVNAVEATDVTKRDGQLLLDGLRRLDELEEAEEKKNAKEIAKKEENEEKEKKHWDLHNRKNVSSLRRISILYEFVLLYSHLYGDLCGEQLVTFGTTVLTFVW